MPQSRSLLTMLLIPLLFVGCSCQQQSVPDQDKVEADPAADFTDVDTPAKTGPVHSTVASQHLSDVAKLIQAYLNAMVVHDIDKANAFWAGGKPPSNPGDDLLRNRDDAILAVRIVNDVPLPVDSQSPPQLLEVPVRLRIETARGLQRVSGSYRLRFRPAEEPETEGKWEIISASLQPELR